MMKRSGAIPIGFLLLISACSSGGGSPRPKGISFDNATATPPVVGTEIAGPGTMLQPLPTGVLLLTEPKDGEGFERNMAVCEAFFRTLPSASEERWKAKTAPNIIPTRWLNSQPTVPSTDCRHLVNQYDYPRAARLLAEIHQEGDRGPVFAGFLGNTYIAVDGSGYETDKLGNFVGKWAKVILKANEDYAELARKREDDLERRESRTNFAERGLPGPILIGYGILKTAAQLVFGAAEVIFGFV
jgi:hypothetical protein